jgi:hypothetical protein
MFIKSQATQRVIGAIFDGRITYSSSSFIDILGDKWKSKQIELYDVHKTPLLDHYRLRVRECHSRQAFHPTHSSSTPWLLSLQPSTAR